MTAETRILVADAMPPLTLTPTSSCRGWQDNPLPRLGRLACVLAALALPALGIAAADTVHRSHGPKAPRVSSWKPPAIGSTRTADPAVSWRDLSSLNSTRARLPSASPASFAIRRVVSGSRATKSTASTRTSSSLRR